MKKRGRKNLFKYVAVIGLLIFLHYIKILAPIEEFIVALVNPVATNLYSISTDVRIAYNERSDKRDLLEVLGNYEQLVKDLTVENAKLKSAVDENRKLREHLKFLEKNEHDFVLANVISGGIFLSSNESDVNIIIDKGSKDGLVFGLAITDSSGVIVGKIIEVKKEISKVSLTTNADCKLAAAILLSSNEARTIGITEGELGLTIKMNFIPQKESIKEGDTVITSGLEEKIPYGLVIGKVMRVERDSNEVWQGVVIEPLVHLDELKIVSVIMP